MATTPIPAPAENAPSPVATPAVPSNPQQAAREAIVQKYDQLYGQEVQAPPAPVSEPAPAPPAPIVAPQVSAPDPESENLKARIAQLEQQLARPLAPVPATPPLTAEPVPATWEDLLLAGKLTEAKAALIKDVQKTIIEQNGPKIVQEAVEVSEAKGQISQFLVTLRTQNPDLAPMERYLLSPVNLRMEEAQKAGKITTPAQYAEHYIQAVNAEVDELRKLRQQLVGAGRDEALVRQKEVLSSTPIPPSPSPTREAAPPVEGTPADPVADYFAKRKQTAAALRRLS